MTEQLKSLVNPIPHRTIIPNPHTKRGNHGEPSYEEVHRLDNNKNA